MNTRLKKISIIILLMLSTASAQALSLIRTSGEVFSHTVLSLLDNPRNEQPWTLLINSQADWEDFYNQPLAYMQFAQGQVPTAPTLDFENYQVVAGGLGIKNNGGYRLIVSDVYEFDNEVNIHVLVIQPSANCLLPQVISYPSATILIRKTNKPLRFTTSQLLDECL